MENNAGSLYLEANYVAGDYTKLAEGLLKLKDAEEHTPICIEADTEDIIAFVGEYHDVSGEIPENNFYRLDLYEALGIVVYDKASFMPLTDDPIYEFTICPFHAIYVGEDKVNEFLGKLGGEPKLTFEDYKNFSPKTIRQQREERPLIKEPVTM